MITVNHKTVLLAFTTLAMAALVSACSSSGHAVAAGASSAPSAAQQACQQVSAVLSDGPDPGSDPVGYAEAQILPLQQIHASDQKVGQAITTLANAYSSYYAANGSGSAVSSALTSAINKINSLCPGAGATT